MSGGYHIVNLGNVNITTADGATILGIYESIESAHRKAILLSGVTIDSVEKNDCFICAEIIDSNYTFTAHGKTFTVTSEDKVTIA